MLLKHDVWVEVFHIEKEKGSTSVYVLLKHDLCVVVFDLKCVEMGIQAIEMD